jgi:L-malate glycosyltransferase
MRILQISSARSIGGGERHLIDLSNELTRRGHDVFLAAVPGSPLPSAMHELAGDKIVEVRLRNALDLASAITLARFARAKRIDLINAHFAKDYPVAAAAARLAGVQLVITRHVLFPMNRLHRSFLRNARTVIAPSNAVADSLRAQNLFDPEKIVTIRYGLNVERFPARRSDRRDRFCIGSIGNLDPVKGLDIFIRAAEIVSNQLPEARFRIVGEDRTRDGRNEEHLRGLIDRLNLSRVVRLAGWSDDVSTVLNEFDIFVSTSRSESFGFAIAEAMLSGVPVVASETEGAREIISDPSLGVLVPTESPDAIANAIVDLHQDAALRETLTVAGREHIRKNFSSERMVDETEALYEQCV